ncbi:alpha-1,6-mannosylglycoprotein 6-beta-N-acetylglucosaminyltransferase B-like [Boleophthalmus pectinirostris]|uniref:alpha-1,6-mannosylglycoprotein 6-beta-N-acetylglucosaminyltransferase B-like n=1 Tax=Boleophthalmus pectinirostris TaxID=150288 RepID=UPI002430D6EC|nr:alpha-1,6-mannosylglycoprotein 6-beta-N-acetylglucosaminyltransferase B-like [Boleophthalmus pectinirostris]
MRAPLRPRSGCLLLCLCMSVLTLILQTFWVPLEMTPDEMTGRSLEGHGFRSLALQLKDLTSRVNKLSRDRDGTRDDLSLLLQSFRKDQQGLAHLVEREIKRVSQKIEKLNHQHEQPLDTPQSQDQYKTQTESNENCKVPSDPTYPVCAEKMEFLRLHWKTDPCYAFYGVDGSTCSLLKYLSQTEDFCPPQVGLNHSPPAWHHKPLSHSEKGEIRTSLAPLYESITNISSPGLRFIRSRVQRMEQRWIHAGLSMNQRSNITVSKKLMVLLYPGTLAGSLGQRFEAMVEKGGPLGELVQWADLSASLTILGHDVTLTTSQHLLHSLIGAAPGRGSCPIQRPLTFDLIYTDYHGLAHLQGAMGIAFRHYQCRYRILDSFGTEPAFNLGSYAHTHEYKTLWGSWGLHPQQYMTMFPHTPDNSFLGFVTEEALKGEVKKEAMHSNKKGNVAVVYAKQEYMWEGKSDYVKVINEEFEIHTTVYKRPGIPSQLPSFVMNHGLLSQDNFVQLLHKAKVFVGLGFPYEGPAPIEAIAMGCAFIQPQFNPPHSSKNNNFYKGKPTTRKISSQHPYAEEFIRKPYVWTVDVNNRTEIQQAVKGILRTEVQPFTPREFTCEGMLERLQAYITHQNFCSKSLPTWPPRSVLRVLLSPLGASCADVCRHSSLTCEPALFYYLNSAAAFTSLELNCSSVEAEVSHLFPAYSPWGQQCHLQVEPLLFSCAGSDPSFRRLCPCREYTPGQVALCPGCS